MPSDTLYMTWFSDVFQSKSIRPPFQLFDKDNHLNKAESRYLFNTEGHVFPIDERFRRKPWEEEEKAPQSSSTVLSVVNVKKNSSFSNVRSLSPLCLAVFRYMYCRLLDFHVVWFSQTKKNFGLSLRHLYRMSDFFRISFLSQFQTHYSIIKPGF